MVLNCVPTLVFDSLVLLGSVLCTLWLDPGYYVLKCVSVLKCVLFFL